MKTVGIRFRPAGKVYTFDPGDLTLAANDQVVVETERGMAIGIVAWPPVEAETPPPAPLKKILRAAEERDIQRAAENRDIQRQAKEAAQRLVAEKRLDMKLLNVDFFFDRSKMIFFFASEGRVDFRELVRDLARQFHTRIEMRQLGVRDEAKMVGGLGCCGRELCCATWLTEFAPISVRMAKSQNISLNPAKISGICGRLMCCLSYENKMYEELSKNMPKVGKRVATAKGEGKVVRRNALEGTFVVLTPEGEVEVGVDDMADLRCEPQKEEGRPEEGRREEGRKEEGRREERRRQEPRKPRPSDEPRRPKPPVEPPPAAEPEEGEEEGEAEVEAVEGEAPAQPAGEPGEQAKSPSRRRRRRRRKPSQDREKKADG